MTENILSFPPSAAPPEPHQAALEPEAERVVVLTDCFECRVEMVGEIGKCRLKFFETNKEALVIHCPRESEALANLITLFPTDDNRAAFAMGAIATLQILHPEGIKS